MCRPTFQRRRLRETRWEQLPGRPAKPHRRKPACLGPTASCRLDNQYFGHSLIERPAHRKTTDDLKQDALQNHSRRSGVAGQLYDANPKPDGTTERRRSWRYADPQVLRHSEPTQCTACFGRLRVHEPGLSPVWHRVEGSAVNLEPIREEPGIVAEERAKREARMGRIPTRWQPLRRNWPRIPNRARNVDGQRNQSSRSSVRHRLRRRTPVGTQPRSPWGQPGRAGCCNRQFRPQAPVIPVASLVAAVSGGTRLDQSNSVGVGRKESEGRSSIWLQSPSAPRETDSRRFPLLHSYFCFPARVFDNA